MKRALIIVLDSVGIGHAPDAAAFGDKGANTVGHIREAVPGFATPHLDRAGLRAAEALAAGDTETPNTAPAWSWGCLTEISAGKDTTTGHWEIAGAPVLEPFRSSAVSLTNSSKRWRKRQESSLSETMRSPERVILEQLGAEHLRTGSPILYTSADSVIQIAAHEALIPVKELYQICEACRVIADRENIGRVIARPFTCEIGSFKRSKNRHDFSLKPPRTVLNELTDAGVKTIGVGKISDIFAGSESRSPTPPQAMRRAARRSSASSIATGIRRSSFLPISSTLTASMAIAAIRKAMLLLWKLLTNGSPNLKPGSPKTCSSSLLLIMETTRPGQEPITPGRKCRY